MTAMDPRLANLLGSAALASLRQRLRRHFSRAAPGESAAVVRLSSLSALERECLALLARRPPRHARSLQLDLAAVDTALREAGLAPSLRDALEQIDGPIVHHAAVRAQTRARWADLVAACAHDALAAWLQSPAAQGLLKRLARQDIATAQRLLDATAAVLSRLPAGGLPRAQLAAETLGDAHALDNGQAVATLVLAVWRRVDSESQDTDAPDGMADTPASAVAARPDDERQRDIWARAGVLVNELARPALLLNLPLAAGAPPDCRPGEPAYISLRQLLRAPAPWAVAGRDVFVCENPNLLAIAADQLGARCAPLVCTDGMPAAAQRTLLGQLVHAGARLHYHGDFDWAGIQIANHVLRTWGAQAWRFALADYTAALADAPLARHPLADSFVEADWDAALAPAMQLHGRAIAEEAVASRLLQDLQAL